MLMATCALATGTKARAVSTAVVENKVLSPRICGSLWVPAGRGIAWIRVCRKKQSSNRSVKALDPFINSPTNDEAVIYLPLRIHCSG
jgi:hypothetical protein